jgi:hypothetical protein
MSNQEVIHILETIIIEKTKMLEPGFAWYEENGWELVIISVSPVDFRYEITDHATIRFFSEEREKFESFLNQLFS